MLAIGLALIGIIPEATPFAIDVPGKNRVTTGSPFRYAAAMAGGIELGQPAVGVRIKLPRIAGDDQKITTVFQVVSRRLPTAKSDKAADPCPPRAVGRRVCGFPLGAQIGVTAILFGAAFSLVFFGALRPFGRLSVTRRDILKACGYGVVSCALFAAAFGVGLIGSQ